MTIWQFKVKSCHDVICRDEFLSTTIFMTHQNIKFRFVCQHQHWSVWIWRRKKVVQFKNISFIFKKEEFLLWIKKRRQINIRSNFYKIFYFCFSWSSNIWLWTWTSLKKIWYSQSFLQCCRKFSQWRILKLFWVMWGLKWNL